MKKIFLALTIATTTFAFSQNSKFGIQFNAGGHFMSEAGTGLTLNSAVTYNFVSSFGLKLDGAIDLVGNDNLNRLGLQLDLNVVKLANEDAKFGLSLHGGAALINNGNFLYNDTYLMRGDDMIALMAGIAPSVRINEHLRVQLDATYLPKMFKVDGNITKYLNTTIGIAYNF